MKKKLVLVTLIISSLIIISSFMGHNVYAGELQNLIDKTKSGDTLQLEDKTYKDHVIIRKPIIIIGKENTIIDGEKKGTIIQIKSSDVVLKNLKIMNSGRSRSSEMEASCIRNMAPNNTFKDLKIHNCFHGLYLNKGDQTNIQNNDIKGYKEGSTGAKGYGIYIKRANENMIKNNTIQYSRDGIYFEYSNDNEIINNKVSKTRYGLHYMYSNFNNFKGNKFIGNIGGAAIMHSDNIVLEKNQFSFNQGSQAFGLIIQGSRDINILENEFHLNQRGLYIEQSTLNLIQENEFFNNKVGIEVWDSSSALTFMKNEFKENKVPVVLVGHSNQNNWNKNKEGNYWQEPMLDLDQNDIGDRPYIQNSSLGNLLKQNELAYLFMNSPAIDLFERSHRLINPDVVMIKDEFPLMDNNHSLTLEKIIISIIVIVITILSVMYLRRSKR
ncbi:nitrous oxide reductase family maturation protein NosD [Macrococcus armenti]|uniref:Nitrous oxide reductase family maturation protein NosD n=1 Tax=Macrococcus armenti TaxID=2875764 RepID=A0ABY3ZU34_9STAP|nr:nitrous oxide reductase family maturation protein NosD [Macrococcus armenti]UOB20395.1 nitrous oxide reductase family maturation protein NosD [Macrococcus armenti]